MDKALTIIIPTYNMEKYLRKCLDSLIVSDENMSRLEVLVVNDGSIDSSSTIAHEYETKYPKTFRVIDKENGNYGSCINRGLKEATGKYVKVLDADDYFDTIVLNNYLSYLDVIFVDLLITNYDVVNLNGDIIKRKEFGVCFEEARKILSFPVVNSDVIFQMHALTYRLEIIKEMNYRQTEGISYTDQEWSIYPIVNVNTVCFYNSTLYKYVIGRVGQTMTSFLDVVNPRQLFQVLLPIVSYYENGNYNMKYDNYIELKLRDQFDTIYSGGLKRKTICMSDLTFFDNQLKNYPKTYTIVDNLKLFKNRYIRYVRIWHSKNAVSFFFLVTIPLRMKKIYDSLTNTR